MRTFIHKSRASGSAGACSSAQAPAGRAVEATIARDQGVGLLDLQDAGCLASRASSSSSSTNSSGNRAATT